MKTTPLIFLVCICGWVLTACAAPSAPATPTNIPQLSGRLTFAGSTTVQPLAAQLGQIFQSQYPDIELEIAAGGSSVGIQAAQDGSADIGMASRSLKDEEKHNIQEFTIALDVIAVINNPGNPVKDLKLEQLKSIYLGETVNWKEVGGKDQPIIVVVRDVNSGTRTAFDELVLNKNEPTAPKIKTAITAGDVVAIVKDDPAAIGYVGFGNIEESIRPLSIEGFLPTVNSVHDGSYKLIRPLLLISGPLSQQPLADTFIQFALSPEGKRVIENGGWIPTK